MSAFISVLTVEFFVPLSHSLKEKRKHIKSLKDKLRARYNVSVAETGYLDEWQRSQLVLVMVSNEKVQLEKQHRAIEDCIAEYRDIQITSFKSEWL